MGDDEINNTNNAFLDTYDVSQYTRLLKNGKEITFNGLDTRINDTYIRGNYLSDNDDDDEQDRSAMDITTRGGQEAWIQMMGNNLSDDENSSYPVSPSQQDKDKDKDNNDNNMTINNIDMNDTVKISPEQGLLVNNIGERDNF